MTRAVGQVEGAAASGVACLWGPVATQDESLRPLATQTLTFLFTDIEGSTAMLRRLGETYTEVLTAHHELIRTCLARHDGTEIAAQGDGFFAAFSSPQACVAAVIEMQRVFISYPWPVGEEVRVRMGVHSGEAAQTTAGLVGLDINRAARIAAAAHGGQVVLSAATAALLRDSLPAGASLKDLGVHRLKDLGRPEKVFQLQADGLPAAFPRLRSLDNPKLLNNLPAQVSSFIGRDAELSEVRRLVTGSRLVTLTGSGGAGKTRLGLQVAAALLDGSGDGVWFADLAPLQDPDLVAATVAHLLGIRADLWPLHDRHGRRGSRPAEPAAGAGQLRACHRRLRQARRCAAAELPAVSRCSRRAGSRWASTASASTGCRPWTRQPTATTWT